MLQRIDGVNFDQHESTAFKAELIANFPARVISREDLVRNKLVSGREQELDVKVLRKAEGAVKYVSLRKSVKKKELPLRSSTPEKN